MRSLQLVLFGIFLASAAALPAACAGEVLAGPVEATVLRVRDGDSIQVAAHIWPGQQLEVSVRLRGIDAPEMRSRCASEKKLAIAARDRLSALTAAGRILLYRIGGGKYYGRVLARVETPDGVDVGRVLLSEKLARPYRGSRRKGWCPKVAAKN